MQGSRTFSAITEKSWRYNKLSDKYRVGIIGLGRIGAQLETDALRQKPASHFGAWLAHKDRCEIVGVSDTNRALRSMFWQPSGTWNCPFYEDFEDLMNQTKPDIVSIATPDETHIKIARIVMRYEPVKLVFLEKPIAKTLSEAQLIIDTAREFKVKLAINHTRRWDPIWQEVGKLCAQERPVEMICMTSGSKIRDSVHMADLINWFQPRHFSFVNPRREEGEVDYLLFAVSILWKTKAITVDSNGLTSKMYVSEPSTHYEGLNELQKTCEVSRRLYPFSPMYYATRQLLDCLDNDSDPLCTGEQGKRALEIALGW